MFRFYQVHFWTIMCIALAAGTLGCSEPKPEQVPVSGQVLIDGKPLEAGFVQVVPNAQRAAFGKIGSDGRFVLSTYQKGDGCVTGTHKVTVIGSQAEGPNTHWYAPKKYVDVRTSGLTLDVNGPRDDVVIELTWGGGKPFVERAGGE